MIKNTDYFQGDIHLNSKIDELRPTNQKPVESPVKKSQKGDVKPLIDTMTIEQLSVYSKQKEEVSKIKEDRHVVLAVVPEEEEGFERLNVERTRREEEGFEVKVIKVKEEPKKAERVEKEKEKEKHKSKKKKKRRSSDEIDS